MEKIKKCRDREIKCLKQSAMLNALLFITYTGAPLLVTLVTFTIYVISDESHVLTAEIVFGTVALFNVVRIPMNQFPRFLIESVKLFVSLRRIDNFLSCEDRLDADESRGREHFNESFVASEEVNQPTIKHCSIEFSDATLSWTKQEKTGALDNINLRVKPGELVAIVGKIGSGKSSLLSAILGEMVQTRGQLVSRGSVSYVSQQPW